MTTDLAAAVERVWPGRSATFEMLGGGITNHNVKVVVDADAFVLRIAGSDTDLLGIDRRAEHEATRAAAAVGVGPEVVAFVEPEGWLVTRFIEGWVPAPEELRQPASLRRVGETLRLVHAGPSLPSRFDAFRVVEEYLATALRRGATVPAEWDWAKAIAARIEHARRSSPRVPCHNDLLNANFIDDGERLRIVDWEYAGVGDPFFDLANFAINHELDAGQRRQLLAAYRGGLREEDARALELMRFMSDFREAMWGVVQSVVSALEFDFDGYATEHFVRLRRTAAEPDFEEALGSGPRVEA
jgi:thiamine kinase-like enzyme